MGVDGFAFFEMDADDIGIPEEVVEVAEGFLIGTDEENSDVIRFVGFQFVEREDFGDVFLIDEAVDLAIAVASDVGENRTVQFGFRLTF